MHIEYQDSSASQLDLPFITGALMPSLHTSTEERKVHLYAPMLRRLQAQSGSKHSFSVSGMQQFDRELIKMKKVLEAKRAQHRKMDQWSRKRYLGRLISRPYLNELAVDIAWLEGRLAKVSYQFDPSRFNRPNPEAQRHLSSLGNGVSA